MITLYGTKDDTSPGTVITSLVLYEHWFNSINANRFNQTLSD